MRTPVLFLIVLILGIGVTARAQDARAASMAAEVTGKPAQPEKKN